MTNKYLLLLVVIVSGIIVVYGAYSYYSIGNSTESSNITNYSDNTSTSLNKTSDNITNNYNDTDIPILNGTDNRTNRSTVSIPLEKPPFID
jgi:hypothetical protein